MCILERADPARRLQRHRRDRRRHLADELGTHTSRAGTVEVDEMHAARAGVDPAARERHRVGGPLDDGVVVAAMQAHGLLAEHVDGRNHLDGSARTTYLYVTVLT